MKGSGLHICFDLGGDSLKVAYAYKKEQTVIYGKLTGDETVGESFPAIAYYDKDEGEWLYANEVTNRSIQSYITLVKIKSLINLLHKNKNRNILLSNSDYYRKKSRFPKFYFPEKKKLFDDMTESEKSGMTFIARGYTPQKVCEGFFQYVAKEIGKSVKTLEKSRGMRFSQVYITIVYPFNSGSEYVTELRRLIGQAFNAEPFAAISSPKALSLFANHRGQLNVNDRVLVFDMGEEQLSVVKASRYGNGLALDCVDGHSLPLEIGGRDIDEAIAEYLEKAIEHRETLGTPSYGNIGHVNESGSYAMQYHLLKQIKSAKKYFSSYVEGDFWRDNGVPIMLYRETVIPMRLTLKDFQQCLGLTDSGKRTDKNVVNKIIDYIISELKKPINRDVTKIFFAGGLVETYGLKEFIIKKLKRYNTRLTILTFDDNNFSQDQYSILSHEDSAYASATGGAVASLCEYKTNTVFSVSFATWVYRHRRPEFGKILSIFVERGECVETDAAGCCKKLTDDTFTGDGVGVEIRYDMIFSVNVTTQEIKDGSGAVADLMNDEKNRKYYFIGNENEEPAIIIGKEEYEFNKYMFSDEALNAVAARKAAKKILGLKVLSGGQDSAIWFYCRVKGKRERIGFQKGIYFREGIIIDADGRATPHIENATEKNQSIGAVPVMLLDKNGSATGRIIEIDAGDIEFEFQNLNDFDGYAK